MRLPVVLALCVPLAGCFSVTGPKSLPEWAMNPQQQEASVRPAKPRQPAVAQRAPRQTQTVVADRTGAVGLPTVVRPAGLANRPTIVRTPPGQQPPLADVIAFSPEWQAREDAADAKLRRSMHICRGC